MQQGMSEELLSVRGYARLRGVTHVAVLKAIQAGRITLVDGKIDRKRADAEWKTNTDPAQQRTKHRRKAPDKAQTNGHDAPEAAPNGAQQVPSDTASYAASRAQREIYLARLAELEYEVKKGKLVDADDVRARIFKIARTARDLLLGVPDRLAPRLAGVSDQREIHRLLSEEVARVCNEISNARTL